MARGGISDKIQILKETTYGDGGLTGEKVFGVTKRFEWKTETSTQQSYGLETAGPGATVNTDGVLLYTGIHEFEFTNGRALEAIMGTINEGTGTFSVAIANRLPSYSAKVIDEAGDNKKLIIKGIKYSKFSIQLIRGEEPIKIVADWVAKTIENTTTFTPTVSTVEPLVFLDGYFQTGTTAQAEVEDITLEIDRAVVVRRFIEQTAAGSRRLISEALEGPLVITYNGNMAAQRAVLEHIWDGETLQDIRSDRNIILNLSRGSTGITLTATGGRHVTSGRVLEKEAEVSLMDFAGVGLAISGTGTFPV